MSEACFIRIISKHQLISVNDLISTGQRAINHQEWCRWRDCFDTGQVQENFIFPWALSGTSESVYSITVSHPVLSHHTCQGLPQITLYFLRGGKRHGFGQSQKLQAERCGLWGGKGHKPAECSSSVTQTSTCSPFQLWCNCRPQLLRSRTAKGWGL